MAIAFNGTCIIFRQEIPIILIRLRIIMSPVREDTGVIIGGAIVVAAAIVGAFIMPTISGYMAKSTTIITLGGRLSLGIIFTIKRTVMLVFRRTLGMTALGSIIMPTITGYMTKSATIITLGARLSWGIILTIKRTVILVLRALGTIMPRIIGSLGIRAFFWVIRRLGLA